MDEPTLGGPAPEPTTRAPLALWDRVKFTLLFLGVFAFLVWGTYLDIEILGGTPADAVRENLRDNGVWIFLAWLEVIRQLHYLLSEHSAGWHRFWSRSVFGGANRRLERLDDWNRFRIGRVLRWLVVIGVAAFVIGRIRDVSPVAAIVGLPATLWSVLPMAMQIVFVVAIGIAQFAALFWFLSKGGVDVIMPNDIRTRFDDVWGQDHVVDRVKENLLFLEAPEKVEERGGYVPGGVLLWGPPGTGKTLIAEAAAGETGKPFVFVEPGAFLNMFMGVGVLKVRALFRKVRKLALRYGGVVVFFDEADSLGNRGRLAPTSAVAAAGMASASVGSCHGLSYLGDASVNAVVRASLVRGDASDAVGGPTRWRDRIVMGGLGGGGGDVMALQALLAELQGLKKPRGFVNRFVRRAMGMRPKPPPRYRMLVMMATNLREALDDALLRPGRIDRIYKVGYPSKVGRIRTYEGYLAKVQHELSADDVDKLATITPYATGATMKDLVNESLINAIHDGRDVITWRDVLKAKQLRELGLPEDVEYIDRERHATAIHEACHAVAAYRARRHLTIDLATIEKGSDYLGMVASIPPEDQFTRWRSEYEADIVVALASLAGERAFFGGDSSSGVMGDLETATQLATLMEGFWGMGTTIASHGVTTRAGVGGAGGGGGGGAGGAGVKKEDRAAIELSSRIERKLTELFDRAHRLLEENRREVLSVAHALERHRTISGDDVRAVVEGELGPVVDGRVYAQPGALAAMEAYHEAAVAAHRAHGRVDAQLPSLALDFTRPSDGNGAARRSRRRTSST